MIQIQMRPLEEQEYTLFKASSCGILPLPAYLTAMCAGLVGVVCTSMQQLFEYGMSMSDGAFGASREALYNGAKSVFLADMSPIALLAKLAHDRTILHWDYVRQCFESTDVLAHFITWQDQL